MYKNVRHQGAQWTATGTYANSGHVDYDVAERVTLLMNATKHHPDNWACAPACKCVYDWCSVAAPAQQRSQVFSRSEHPRARSPGCTLFPQESWRPFFSCRPQNTKAAKAAVKIKQIKRSAVRMVTFLLPKQSKAIGRVEPGRWIFQPGHLIWYSAATAGAVLTCITTVSYHDQYYCHRFLQAAK